ncbi:MAG: phosphate ABC transporter substrate-binding protein PstS [Marmoricola sp.]
MNVTSLRRVAVPAAAALTLSLSLAACGSSSSGGGSGLSGTINGAGSTAQQAAQAAWTQGFQTANSGATINYNPVGSGGGVTKFNAGAVDFAGSDSALDPTKGEVAAAKSRCGGSVIEVPDYISPIAVAFHVPGVTKLNLDAATIAGIFSNKITKWNAPQIAALNSGVSLPNLSIAPIHRSDKSGTTNNFTNYLSQAAPSAWTEKPDSNWPKSITGEGATGTSGVVSALTAANGGIAYIDDSQAGPFSKASIKVGSSFIQPSAAGAAKDVELSKQKSGRDATDYALSVERTSTDPTAYPITLVSYLIACPTYPAAKEKLVKAYLLHIVSAAGQAEAQKTAGSAPLPASLSAKATSFFNAITAK